MNDLTLCMRILCLSQSVINTTDELTDRVIFKHKFKQQTKSYLKVVEGMVDDLAWTLRTWTSTLR